LTAGQNSILVILGILPILVQTTNKAEIIDEKQRSQCFAGKAGKNAEENYLNPPVGGFK
jgi:hypothetical protein